MTELTPGVYLYCSAIPPGCKGHAYHLHGFVLDIPSRQQKVLVECLSGPDKGLLFVCSRENFRLRYKPRDEPAADLDSPPPVRSTHTSRPAPEPSVHGSGV